MLFLYVLFLNLSELVFKRTRLHKTLLMNVNMSKCLEFVNIRQIVLLT